MLCVLPGKLSLDYGTLAVTGCTCSWERWCGWLPVLALRLLGGCNSSLSISCPSLVSMLTALAWLVPISGACSGGALKPLSSHTLKQWSLASQTVPDFPPDSLLAHCGTLAHFRLCSFRQPQSSPRDLTFEARASAPSPHPSWPVSRQASQAGECWLVAILHARTSLPCPL